MRIVPFTTEKPLRVLMLEESESDAALISDELQRVGTHMLIMRAESAESFGTALRTFAPDVVLSGHSLAHPEASAALEILRAARPTIPFIVITPSLAGAQTGATIRAGAENLIGRTYLSALDEVITEALAVRRPLRALTERQIEVLRLIAEGKRTRAIAAQLGISVKTVESHRGELMKRLGVNGAVSLVRYAIRVGLVVSTL